MKKCILVFITFLSCNIIFAQKNHCAIQVAPIFNSEEEWGTNSYEINAQYVRDCGKIFHIGVGAGFGSATPIKWKSAWKPAYDEGENKEDIIFIPLFAKAKIDFGTKPSHFYAALKIGTRIASVESYGGENFNPYRFNITPSIGYDFKIHKYKLGVEFILDSNFMQYEEINYVWNDTLEKYIYDNYQLKKDSMWAGVGFGITFQF
jgi:hypothetical protein